MSVQTAPASKENPRILALKQRHNELKQKVEKAQQDLTTTDFYLKQLKKEKLIVKEEIENFKDVASA